MKRPRGPLLWRLSSLRRQASFLLVLLALFALGWLAHVDPARALQAAPLPQGPTRLPSAANGQALYAENCAPCHGPAGGGDGSTAATLPNGATALADPAIARAATPSEWFDITKNGRMDRFMPPWKNRLDDGQIWDAVAFAYALHTPEQEIVRGEQVWEERCAACHGDTGAGDGPQAVANNWRMPAFGDQNYAAGRSQDAWFQVTSGGRDAMPAFEDALPDEDIWAALAYARTFSYQPLVAAEIPQGRGRLAGRVTNGTPGGGSVAGLTVTLNAFEKLSPLQTRESQVAEDGSFHFDQLPTGPDYAYVVTAQYGDNAFGSEIVSIDEDQAETQLPVTVYESSDKPGEIQVNLAQWFVESHQGSLLVGELYRLTHNADRVYLGGAEVAPGKRAVLTFNLPAKATALALDGGEVGDRFVRTPDGVVDTRPLLPGQSQILMRYLLPYDGSRAELAHSIPYPVDQFSVLVAEGVDVATDLPKQGPQTVAERNWVSYGGSSVPANQPVRLRLSGLPKAESSAMTAPNTSAAVVAHHPALLIGIGVTAALVASAVLAAFLLRKPRETSAGSGRRTVAEPIPNQPAERQRLLQGIAELDDQFAAGELDEATYQRQRAALKRSVLVIAQEAENLAHADAASASDADLARQAAP